MEKNSYEDFLINSNSNVRDAMKQLDRNASKVLFVVDDKKYLLGSISDGDIRRWLLKKGTLSDFIDIVYHKNPLIMRNSDSSDFILKKMEEKNIDFVPIVDDLGVVCDVFLFKEKTTKSLKLNKNNIDMPVVIMAGGKGTRMAPFTNVLPKPLIPIGDKTILEIIIDEFFKYGCKKFYLTINYRGDMIRAYLDNIEKKYIVQYLNEKEFLGTAGSLALFPVDEETKTILVSNCDIIVKANYYDVIEFHKKSNAWLTVLSSYQHHTIPYGVINFIEGGIVTKLEEKPEYSFCVNTGVYILQSDCLKYIPKNSVYHMTNLMEDLINDGKRVVTYPVNEKDYIDIGQWDEYRRAVSLLM